ncbi:MAG TPA: hypothetical protein VGN37_07170 [Actinocatenispora sp.]
MSPTDPSNGGAEPEASPVPPVIVSGAAAFGGDVTIRGVNAAGRDVRIDHQDVYRTYVDASRHFSLFGLRHRGGDTGVRARVRRMLADVMRQHWIGREDTAASLPVRFTERPEAVVSPRDTVLVTADPPRRSFPAGATLTDVRAAVGASALVLGAPGSGKTYQLLRLAGDLLADAERDEAARIPVYLHLGSWTRSSGSLLAWAAAELGRTFRVPAKFDLRRVIEAEVTLLLDGFDEVAREHRAGCARAIDEFRDRHGDVPVVLCSRTTEYDAAGVRLALDGAVHIEPVTPAEAEAYLAALGAGGLRRMLDADPRLRRLLTSPLFVTFMLDAYGTDPAQGTAPATAHPDTRGTAPAAPGTGGAADRVFADYVAAMFRRPVPRTLPAYRPEQVTRWLAWLARALRRRRHPVFYLDQLSPAWLSAADRDRAVRWERGVLAVLVVACCWLKAALMVPTGHTGTAAIALWVVVWPAAFGWSLDRFRVGRYTADVTFRAVRSGLLAWVRNPVTILLAVALVACWRVPPVRIPLFSTVFAHPVDLRVLCAMLMTTLLPVLMWTHARWFDFWVVRPRSPGDQVRALPSRSLLVGAVVAAVVLVHQLALGWLETPQFGWAYAVLHALQMVPLVVLGTAWVAGGGTYVRHRVTCRILRRHDLGPARYADFLDHASRRALLVRDGGGYVFAHARLRRWFAERAPGS